MSYLWIKSLHLLAVISWMAGMLYLPRLFVYHAEVQHGSAQSDLFSTMEFRLQRYIMAPALVVTWLTGLYLAVSGHFLSAPWLHGKLALVLLMTAVHGYLAWLRRQFAVGANTRTSRFYRILNEVPTVLMVFIVIFVVVKPLS